MDSSPYGICETSYKNSTKNAALILRIFASRSALQLIGELGLGQGNRVAPFPLGQLQPLVQLFVKIAIAQLFEDVSVPASSILKALLQCGQMILCMAIGPLFVGWTGGNWPNLPTGH